jgi:hypothetical protein
MLLHHIDTLNREVVNVDPGSHDPALTLVTASQNHDLITLANLVHQLAPTGF